MITMMKQKLFLVILIIFSIGETSCAHNSPVSNGTDTFTTKSGKIIKITPIKHASLEITFDKLVFQIDPVMSVNGSITDYSHYQKADFILITHEHHDHFDPKAIELLSKNNTKIVLNQDCFNELKEGVNLKNGDILNLADDINLYVVAAYNTTPEHLKYHPRGRGNGYILDFDGIRIYIAGDTEVIPEMKKLGSIDIAFLPCNQPYTMTPEQLHEAVVIIKPKVLYPYHYSMTSKKEMLKATSGLNIDVRIRNL